MTLTIDFNWDCKFPFELSTDTYWGLDRLEEHIVIHNCKCITYDDMLKVLPSNDDRVRELYRELLYDKQSLLNRLWTLCQQVETVDQRVAIDNAAETYRAAKERLRQDLLAIGYVEGPEGHEGPRLAPSMIGNHPTVHAAKNALIELELYTLPLSVHCMAGRQLHKLNAEIEEAERGTNANHQRMEATKCQVN